MPRFVFHSHAVGLALPDDEARAHAALGQHGGNAGRYSGSYNDGTISFSSSSSNIAGFGLPGSYVTEASTETWNLNIANVVTADRLYARVISTHYTNGEPAAYTIERIISNLRVNGELIDPATLPQTRVVPDFGTVYLGEVVDFGPERKKHTLVRVDSTLAAARCSIGDTDNNGTPVPPS